MSETYKKARRLGVEYKHADLKDMETRYERVRDNIEGNVKARGEVYLPHPAPNQLKGDAETVKASTERYKVYHQRANYLPVTKRTQQGLVGQVFLRAPTVVLPEALGYMSDSATSTGVGLLALAEKAVGENVAMGRGGFVVDYKQNGGTRAYIDFVCAEDIVTWAEATPEDLPESDGANSLRMLMVRRFDEVLSADFVKVELVPRLVHYVMANGQCLYRFMTPRQPWTAFQPLMVKDAPLPAIPFYFVGAEDNDARVDFPPLLELADLNVGHFRNSADYEEMAFVAGQATPVFTGIDEDWNNNVLKNKVQFGSRGGIPLPAGANAFLLQVNPNTLAKEAMDSKAAQMVAIGARLIEERKIRRTATEASIEDQAYHSILGKMAKNVSAALTKALRTAMRFDGVAAADSANKLVFVLNTDFSHLGLTPDARRVSVEEWLAGAISLRELRKTLRQANPHLDVDDKTALTEIDAEKKQRIDAMPKKGDNTGSSASNSGEPPENEEEN